MKLDLGPEPDLGGQAADCSSIEQFSTNQGCEFWAVDLPNVSVVPPFSIDVTPHDQQFAVVVTNTASDAIANVSIYVGDGDTPVDGGPVPVDTMRVFALDPLSISPGTTSSDGQAYRIESDVPIVAYQFQPLDNTSPVYSNDATLLFPTHVLATDYTAITGDATIVGADGFSVSDVNTGAFVAVVATEDDTTVTLYPTVALHPGAYQGVVLDRGQVLTAISSERGAPTYGNLSGTRVVADKPVAVFSGSVATSEPSSANDCCADHLEHQMPPLAAWGTRYVAAPAASAVGVGDDASLFRIVGAFDGTTLEYSPAAPPGAPTTIGAYEMVQFVTDAPFAVRSTEEDKPIAVAQFLLSNQYLGGLGRPGDPSMIVLPAVEQFQNKYVFLMPQGYANNRVTVVRPDTAAVVLDGIELPTVGFQPLGIFGNVDYTYAHLELDPGSHVLESDAPVGIIVSGHSSDVSYGYAGGSGVELISTPPVPPG